MKPKRLGFACFSSDGHLHPSLALATTMSQRGHEVIFYCLANGITKIERRGFQTRVYGEIEFTTENILDSYRQLGTMSGMQAVRATLNALKQRASAGLREFPALFEHDNLDGVIVDQVVPDGAAVCRAERLPYVTVSNALPVNLTNEVPPVFSHGLSTRGAWPWIRNRALNGLATYLSRPLMAEINRFQTLRGLPVFGEAAQLRSDLAHITQIPKSFDFPQNDLPPHFHYTGPFHTAGARTNVEFPWSKIDSDRPLVYMSMGTLQNQIATVFRAVAEACEPLPVQLVVSLGGSSDAAEWQDLPGDPIVVSYAPQLELLSRADLCVTHGGLNTALESLAQGVPMLAIPITNDQPGVAARIESGGMGRRLFLRKLTSERIRKAMETILNDRSYRSAAQTMQHTIAASNGLERAADIIDQAFDTNRPVVAPR